ncbi:17706_t:CDS:2, partial [Racocetra persica]
GFTANLCEISVYFNDDCVICISKEIIGLSRSITIKYDIDKESPNKMFKLESVVVCSVKFDAYKTVIPPGTISLSNCLKKRASVRVKIASQTAIQIILPEYKESTSYHKYFTINNLFDNEDFSFSVFKDLLPFPEQGNIFIGFRTHQTTGYSVERESIDLAQQTLSIYNTEMLCSAGTLCRVLYEDEMSQVSQSYKVAKVAPIIDKTRFEARSAHALKHFTFKQSTPDVK